MRFRTDQEVEAGKRAIDEGVGDRSRDGCDACYGIDGGRWRGCRLGVEYGTGIRLQSDVTAGEVGLDAIAQIVGERHLGNRRVDRDLKLRLIDLQQGGFDRPIVRLIRVDQQGVVDGIGRDPHVLQHRLAVA